MTIPGNAQLPLYLPDGTHVGTIDLRQMAAHIIRQTVATLESEGRLLPAAPPCIVCGQPFTRSRRNKTICDSPACQSARNAEHQRTYHDKKARATAALIAAPAPACPDCGAVQTYSKNRKCHFCKPCTRAKAAAASLAARVASGKIKPRPAATPPVEAPASATEKPAQPAEANPAIIGRVDFTALPASRQRPSLPQTIVVAADSGRYDADGVFAVEVGYHNGQPRLRARRFCSVDEYAEKAAVVTLDRAANVWRAEVPQEMAQ